MPEVGEQSSPNEPRPRILAIAGGSCSGKTTLSDLVVDTIGSEQSILIRTDNYYKADLLDSAPEGKANFDHPSAIDFELLKSNLSDLRSSRPIEGPLWDFVAHRRKTETLHYEPKEIIVVEGIFALYSRDLNDVYDHSCFLECPEVLRLDRRIQRDIAERGRNEWSVREQFETQVAPMHDEFVEPTKHLAHTIVSQAEYCTKPDDLVTKLLAPLVAETF